MSKKPLNIAVILLSVLFAGQSFAQIEVEDANVVMDISMEAHVSLLEIQARIVLEYASIIQDIDLIYPDDVLQSSADVVPRVEVEYASIIQDIDLTYPDDVLLSSNTVLSRIEIEYASVIQDIDLIYPLDVLLSSADVVPRILAEYVSVIQDISLVPPPEKEIQPRIIVEYASIVQDIPLSYPESTVGVSRKVTPRIVVEFASVTQDLNVQPFTVGLLGSISTHWYNWATSFPEYQEITQQFGFVRDGAWWSQLEPTDHTTTEQWGAAGWNYSWSFSIKNCNQDATYDSGYDKLVDKFQSPKTPDLLLLLDIHNDKLSADANNITYDQYYDYVYHVVERYDGDGIDDMPDLFRPVRYFEIGNEVDSSNVQHSHNLTFENYVNNRLIPAYLAAKAANPDAVILNAGLALGGDASFDLTYLNNMLDLLQNNGGEQNNFFMDVLALHYYYDPQNPEYFYPNINLVKDLLGTKGLREKPIWVTEYGIATKNDPGGQIREEDQAAVLLRYKGLMHAHGIQNSFIYNLKDENSSAPDDWENVYGLYNVVCQSSSEVIDEKMAVSVMDTFNRKTRGLSYIKINPESERNNGVFKIVFGNTHRRLYLLWHTAFDQTGINPNRSGESKDIQLSIGPNTATLSDMHGNLIAENLQTGSIITIGEQPVYLEMDPFIDDYDIDGIPNDWEEEHGMNPYDASDAAKDYDNDGLNNLVEFLDGIDPRNPDTDGDGMLDGWELENGLDPHIDDADLHADNDGLSNGEEFRYRTDPNDDDTDGDGVSDSDEISNGTDPLAWSSSLISETSELTLSPGAGRTIPLILENTSRKTDIFTLALIGVDESWYTLEATEVPLVPGEIRHIALRIDIPGDCSLISADYDIQVSALSPITGLVANGGADIVLHLVEEPIISKLMPQSGDVLSTNSTQITWQTDADTTTEAYYRIVGETDFTRVDDVGGVDHAVLMEGLTWDAIYEWYVASSTDCATGTTAIFTFTVQGGVVFMAKESIHEISRDYDQQITIAIENRDTAEHSVLVEVISPDDELIAGFVGSGSTDEPLVLAAAETTALTLALHAQDTIKNHHVLNFKLIADADTSNPIVDYARAVIDVTDPVFKLVFEEISSNPAILTNTYRITNNGDTITDLTVVAPDADLSDDGWIDKVISFDQPVGSSTEGGPTDNALGPNDRGYVSIDIPETLILQFTDNSALDGEGPDIHIYEIGGDNSYIDVYGSKDGIIWVFLKNGYGSLMIDLSASGLEYVNYLKFVGKDNLGTYDGYDLDAVEALNSGAHLNSGTHIDDEAARIVFQPKVEHMRLPHGEFVDFKATFNATADMTQWAGELFAHGAGQTVSLSTQFGCETGTSLYDVTLADASVCLKKASWYCTNRPKIRMNLDVPSGINSAEIQRARLYINFSLKVAFGTYRNHDVIVRFNGEVVESLLNTIPEGSYGIEIPPALIRTGEEGIGRNQVTLESRHMNGGHYAIASDIQLILDVNSLNKGSVCAVSQTEAEQLAQDIPYVCDGTPEWQPYPRPGSVTALDEDGDPKPNFSPGETTQLRLTLSNPDLDERNCSLIFQIDDDFSDSLPIFEQDYSFTIQPGGTLLQPFWWTLPPDTAVGFYHVKVILSCPGDQDKEYLFRNAIAVYRSFPGYIVTPTYFNFGDHCCPVNFFRNAITI